MDIIMIVTLDDTQAFNPKYARVEVTQPALGKAYKVEVTYDDTDDFQSYGPFLFIDAVVYAEHALTLPEGKRLAFLEDMDRKTNPANYPANDWSGLLDGIKR